MKRRNFLLLTAGLGISLIGGAILQFRSPLEVQQSLLAQQPRPAPPPATLLVSVAASLQDAMQAIQTDFEKAHPEIALSYNFGSSGALQQQIEQGAPVDVFISAGVPQMDALEDQDLLLSGTRQDLLGNSLVLITPDDSMLGLDNFIDLTQPAVKRISIGEFRSVPAGQYAEQVFNSLDILAATQPRLVFANSVRGVLAAVESGHVDAGLVYATDAALSPQVAVVAIASVGLHNPITYPLAILGEAANPETAQTFVKYLSSDAAGTVFEDFGFTVLN
ncbi:MAG: molybdate ABC transporter substrate-binding protein [Nodosilinea sp.]